MLQLWNESWRINLGYVLSKFYLAMCIRRVYLVIVRTFNVNRGSWKGNFSNEFRTFYITSLYKFASFFRYHIVQNVYLFQHDYFLVRYSFFPSLSLAVFHSFILFQFRLFSCSAFQIILLLHDISYIKIVAHSLLVFVPFQFQLHCMCLYVHSIATWSREGRTKEERNGKKIKRTRRKKVENANISSE